MMQASVCYKLCLRPILSIWRRCCYFLLLAAAVVTSFFTSSSYAKNGDVFELIVAYTSYRESTQKSLKIIMDHTVDKYGPYKIVRGPEMNRARSEEGMMENEIHVMWGAFSKKRLERLRPLYTYVTLASPRVCIIAKGTESKFFGVKTLDEWNRRGLTTGSGTFWSDVAIYRENNMLLETTPKSKLLYPMVANERYDCFNRGAEEVFDNYEKYKHLGIEIEKTLAFVFKAKYSGFLLAPDNSYLKERFNYGINAAWENNAFDGDIEYYNTEQRKKFKNLHFENRSFIFLENPDAVKNVEVRAVNQKFIEGFTNN